MLNGSVELFIHYESLCIFYYNLQQPGEPFPMDVQLVAGWMAAANLFYESIGLGGEAPLFRIIRGDDELRMWLGNETHGTLLLRGLGDLSEQTYHELDELLKGIILRFERVYAQEIQDYLERNATSFPGIEEHIRDEVEKMKTHMYASYLMQILGTAINRNVFRRRAEELLASFNPLHGNPTTTLTQLTAHNHLIWSELDEYQREHITMARLISRINRDSKQIWTLFGIPLIYPLSLP
jgi:hypothetical protein